MKNFMKFLITCLTVIFVSCSLTPEVEVSPAQEYKITYTVSGTGKDAVTVNGPATAKSGDTVTFTIDGIEFDKRLVSVEYYYIFNSDCDYNEATGEYSFTMPGLDTPVTIVVEQLTDVSKDGAISWRGIQPSQIVPGDSVQELTFNVDASWTTSCTVELTSTDESVIPASALSYKELTEGNSNAITGVTITVDLTQVSPGQTYLIAYFKSGNSSSQKGEITKRIEVTGTPEETVLTATLKVDLSAFAGGDDPSPENMYLQLTDQNYQYGSQIEQRRQFDFSDYTAGSNVFTLENIEFAEGHAYKVTVGCLQPVSGDSYIISDFISGGGSTTDDDYNGIKDSVLRVKTDNSTIKINVQNEVVSLS